MMLRVICVGTVLSAGGASYAAVIYDYTAETTAFASPAGSVGYDIFLQETLTAGSASLITADGGMDAAAFVWSAPAAPW